MCLLFWNLHNLKVHVSWQENPRIKNWRYQELGRSTNCKSWGQCWESRLCRLRSTEKWIGNGREKAPPIASRFACDLVSTDREVVIGPSMSLHIVWLACDKRLHLIKVPCCLFRKPWLDDYANDKDELD